MFALFYTFLLHKWCQEKNACTVLAKPQRSSLRIHLCASERSERAIFGGFNSFTVKKVSFFTINVKFKVILSSKSGGDVCTGHPPHPKKWGGYIPPIPPGIYASGFQATMYGSQKSHYPWLKCHKNEEKFDNIWLWFRNGHRIKTTQPISMILVSLFPEDNVLSDEITNN